MAFMDILFPTKQQSTKEGAQNSIKITLARIPQDLEKICACRQSALPRKANGEPQTLDEAAETAGISFGDRKFYQAEGLQDPRSSFVCLLAEDTSRKVALGCAEIRLPQPRTSGNLLASVPTANIRNVFVREEARGQGIAKRLMASMEKMALEVSPKVLLTLDVATSNTAAITLYKSLGFRPRGPVYAATLALGEITGAPLLIAMEKRVGVP